MTLIQFSCLETAFHNHQYHRMLAEELNQSDQFEMECSIWQHGDVVWKIPVNNNQIIILVVHIYIVRLLLASWHTALANSNYPKLDGNT